MIYSTEAHTITRASTFGGDVFVVGMSADGTLCEEPVTLILGDENSSEADMLTVNGNSENMTVDVNGSAIFVCTGNCVDIYSNVKISNS